VAVVQYILKIPIEAYDIRENEICAVEERYPAFIDETGDPFIHKDPARYNDPTVFPVLTVSALVVSTTVYKEVLRPAIDDIKMHFWATRDIHLHSNEIRRKDGIFKVLLDPVKYDEFKHMMLAALEKSSITIISSSINKMKLLEKAEIFKQYKECLLPRSRLGLSITQKSASTTLMMKFFSSPRKRT
jgi:hypothetical protein